MKIKLTVEIEDVGDAAVDRLAQALEHFAPQAPQPAERKPRHLKWIDRRNGRSIVLANGKGTMQQ